MTDAESKLETEEAAEPDYGLAVPINFDALTEAEVRQRLECLEGIVQRMIQDGRTVARPSPNTRLGRLAQWIRRFVASTAHDAITLTALASFGYGLWMAWPPAAPMVVGGLILTACVFGKLRGVPRKKD